MTDTPKTKAATDATVATIRPSDQRLEHFPITFFAISMGLMGLVLALHAASQNLPWAGGAARLSLWVGMIIFAMIAVLYMTKCIVYPAAVKREWHHPVKLAFFPAATISLLLAATALYGSYPGIAHLIWIVGTVGQGILTIAVVSGWISHRTFEFGHLTPAWFIPAVGNVIVPVAGVQMGYVEISWLFFSGGLIFWVVLLTLVMNRLVFHNPIPARLFPTMVILIAPPALAFVAYVRLTGQIDPFAHILLNVAYVFAALVVVQVPKLLRLPFGLSWWALSFPIAALTIASFVYARIAVSPGHIIIGFISLATLGVIIVGLVWRTGVAILRQEICQPE